MYSPCISFHTTELHSTTLALLISYILRLLLFKQWIWTNNYVNFNFGMISTHYNCTYILILIRYSTMGNGSFPGVKRPGRGVDHPPPFSAEVTERVALYLYSPSGPSWPVIGWILSLPLFLFSSPWRWQHEWPKYVFHYYVIKLHPLIQVHFLVPLNNFIHLIHAWNNGTY